MATTATKSDADARFAGFEDIVTDISDVTGVLGEVKEFVKNKVIDHLDEVCQRFIETSPFMVMATTGAGDYIDLSPKGDPAGFVRILDEKRLAIPDRPGNRRADTFHNLLKNPQLGLIFMIPGKLETLRVSGEARIVRDQKLRESMAVDAKVPDLAVVLYVERAFIHCPKCMVRSGLWTPEKWPDASAIPDIGQAMIQHARLDMTVEELGAYANREGLTKLY